MLIRNHWVSSLLVSVFLVPAFGSFFTGSLISSLFDPRTFASTVLLLFTNFWACLFFFSSSFATFLIFCSAVLLNWARIFLAYRVSTRLFFLSDSVPFLAACLAFERASLASSALTWIFPLDCLMILASSESWRLNELANFLNFLWYSLTS